MNVNPGGLLREAMTEMLSVLHRGYVRGRKATRFTPIRDLTTLQNVS